MIKILITVGNVVLKVIRGIIIMGIFISPMFIIPFISFYGEVNPPKDQIEGSAIFAIVFTAFIWPLILSIPITFYYRCRGIDFWKHDFNN